MEKIQMEKVKYIKAVSSKNVLQPKKNGSPTDLILVSQNFFIILPIIATQQDISLCKKIFYNQINDFCCFPVVLSFSPQPCAGAQHTHRHPTYSPE